MVTRSFFSTKSIASIREIADQRRLFAGLDIFLLDGLERLLPIVAVAHLARRLFHLGLAPRKFLVGDLDQFFGRVRDHFVLEALR